MDFLSKCFEWEPSLRLTPNAALQHPWMREKFNSAAKANNLSYLEKRNHKPRHL